MGYGVYWDEWAGRFCGHQVYSVCESPECREQIDRGLDYRCGGDGNRIGCGLFFCQKHLQKSLGGKFVCTRCYHARPKHKKKPDTIRWMFHQISDSSWEKWRSDNKAIVKKMIDKVRRSLPTDY